MASDVIDVISHGSDPAEISEVEAQHIVGEQWASWIGSEMVQRSPSRSIVNAAPHPLCGERGPLTIEKHGVRMEIPQDIRWQHEFDFQTIGAPCGIPNGFVPCGLCVRAFPEEVVFEKLVSISIPTHYGVTHVLRSRRSHGHWCCDVLDSCEYNCAGCVTFKVNQFCDFVPVWPEGGAAVPIRIQPMLHQSTSIVTLICWHELFCRTCQFESKLRIKEMIDAEGYVELEYATFRCSKDHATVCVDIGSHITELDLFPDQFPQVYMGDPWQPIGDVLFRRSFPGSCNGLVLDFCWTKLRRSFDSLYPN